MLHVSSYRRNWYDIYSFSYKEADFSQYRRIEWCKVCEHLRNFVLSAIMTKLHTCWHALNFLVFVVWQGKSFSHPDNGSSGKELWKWKVGGEGQRKITNPCFMITAGKQELQGTSEWANNRCTSNNHHIEVNLRTRIAQVPNSAAAINFSFKWPPWKLYLLLYRFNNYILSLFMA